MVYVCSLTPPCGSAGVSNHYLVNTHSEAALLYNDSSVNENGHAATAFRILAQPECNFLEEFERDEQRFVRRLVISMGGLAPHL